MGSRKLGLILFKLSSQVRTRGRATAGGGGGATARACTINTLISSEAGTPLLRRFFGAIFMLFFHAELVERFRLRAALLERVLAGLGLAIELFLAFLMILLVAPDLARLLHLGPAAGD